MCMMCEEDAIYSAYLEWKAQKEREEVAAASNPTPQPDGPQAAPDTPKPHTPKPSFTCD